MKYWLYQLTRKNWRPRDFSADVWEHQDDDDIVAWDWDESMKVVRHGKRFPLRGDKVIFFFCKTGLKNKDREKPSIYGLGEVLSFGTSTRIQFKALPPTDKLKLRPLWNSEVEEIVDSVRGGAPRGTLWAMTADDFKRLYEQFVQRYPLSLVAS